MSKDYPMITGLKIELADKAILKIIAAMHIEPDSGKIAQIIQEHNGRYRFYLDKVKMFFALEPSGVIVAKQNEQILGFIVVSKSVNEIKSLSLRRGYLLHFGLKSLFLRYGLGQEILKKSVLAFYANFVSRGTFKERVRVPDTKIWALVVMKETRGKGIGLRLIEAACNYARRQGAGAMGITVAHNNNAALKTYQKAGFHIIGSCLESTGPSYYLTKSLNLFSVEPSSMPRLGGVGRAGWKRPIKILYLITRLVPGGAAKIVLSLCRYLDPNKYDIKLLSGAEDHFQDDLIPKHIGFTILPSLVRSINPFKDIEALVRLYAFIRQGHYDIVHTHTSKAGMVGRWAARLAGVPIIIHSPHGHIFSPNAQIPGVPRLLLSTLLFLERQAARFTSRLITPTEIEKKEELSLGIGRPNQFRVIPNGIEFEEIIAQSPKSAQGNPIIATAGRLSTEKGFPYLLAAMPRLIKEFPQIKLLIMGDGPLRNELETYVKVHHLQNNVIFLGLLKDIRPTLMQAEIFVLPSLYEAFGIVLVEAMSLKKLVVATRAGSITEVVKDGQTGILVEPANPDALAEAIMRGLKDGALRQRLTEAAYTYAREHFDIKQTVAQVETVYRELLKRL